MYIGMGTSLWRRVYVYWVAYGGECMFTGWLMDERSVCILGWVPAYGGECMYTGWLMEESVCILGGLWMREVYVYWDGCQLMDESVCLLGGLWRRVYVYWVAYGGECMYTGWLMEESVCTVIPRDIYPHFSHQISHVKLCLRIIDGYKKPLVMCVGNLVKPAARRQHCTSSLPANVCPVIRHQSSLIS